MRCLMNWVRWLPSTLLICFTPLHAATDARTLSTTVCAACHGADGNSIADAFPRLAGQQPEYLLKQLTDFVAGKRKNDVMVPFLPSLKSANLKEVAQHFSALAPAKGSSAAGEAGAGKQLYESGNLDKGVPGCVGCHGPGGQGVALNARLAGQYQSYLVAQIKAFKNGTRTNDLARVMRNAVANLTDADINAVAEYLAAQ